MRIRQLGLFVLTLLGGVASGQAQHFLSAGALGGVPLLDAFHAVQPQGTPDCRDCYYSYYHPATKRFTAGVALEIRPAHTFTVEGDILYTRLNYSSFAKHDQPDINAFSFTFASVGASRWAVPIMLKHRFSERRVRPFLSAGAALSFVTGVRQAIDQGAQLLSGPDTFPYKFNHTTSNTSMDLLHSAAAGLVVAGGIEWRIGPARAAPQLRYTRWPVSNFRNGEQFYSNKNETVFLLEVLF